MLDYLKKPIFAISLAVVFTALLAAASLAQGPGQGPGGGQGGQFGQFREQHKFTFQLMSMVRHIQDIDKDPKYTLSPGQAKQMLAVLKPLRSKQKLTQDQSKQALKDLKKVFNLNQLNAMAKIKPRPQGGERRPNMGDRPAGDRARRPRMDPAAMKDFNPFYAKADTNDQFGAERATRWNAFFTGLEKKSKTVKQTQPAARKPAKPSAKKPTSRK